MPYTPRGGSRPTERFARIGGSGEFYISYFQEPGRAEAEIESDVRGWLAGIYTALSGDTLARDGEGDPLVVAAGGRMSDQFGRGPLPSWLGEDELDVYAGEFERTGLTGALNRYRNVDRDWLDLAAWDRAPLRAPSLFVGGELDPSLNRMARAVEAHRVTLPNLAASHILGGCGHWVQQERPDTVNRLLVDWLASLAGLVPGMG